MLSTTALTIAFGVVASVAAQSASITSMTSGTIAQPSGPTIYVSYPAGGPDGIDGDLSSETLVASIVTVRDQSTTLVLGCPSGVAQSDCIFSTGFTITAAPSSLIATIANAGNTITESCSFSSGRGACTVTGVLMPDATGSGSTITETIPLTSVTSVPVIVTAGPTAGLGGSSGGSTTTTRSPNAAMPLAPGGFAAALLGFAAFYL